METKPEVFISYHTSTAEDVVRQVCAALENAGISCWYAPRNVVGDYASSIVDGIRHCKVFLLVLNAGADRSEDVRNEINCAFERFRQHEDIALLPFKVDNCSLSDAVLYYLGRIHIMDGGLPPELLRIQELIERINHLLNNKQERTCYVTNEASAILPQAQPEQKLYRIVGSTVAKNNNFVGRQRELSQMHSLLSEAPHKLILSGMGGVGKSELVSAYCSQYRDDYDVTLWVTFDTSLQKTLASDFTFPIQGLERRDYPQDSDADYFQRKLRLLNEISDRRVLVILDNFDTPEDPNLETLARANCSMIFTSRYHGLSEHVPEVEVTGILEEEDLLTLFRREYKRMLTPADLTDAKKLMRQLDGHPLSIRLFASAMAANRIPPRKMLSLLTDSPDQLRKTGNLAGTVHTRLKQVFSLAALNEKELFVLKNLVLMPLQGVDVGDFNQWTGLDDFSVIDELIRKSWVVYDEVADRMHLHPLVCELMAEQLQADPGCCDGLLTSLIELCGSIDSYPGEYKRYIFECFSAVAARLPAEHPRHWDVSWAYAVMVMYQSWFEEAIPLMQQLRNQTPDLLHVLEISQWIAHSCVLCGKPNDAIREAQIGLDYIRDNSLDTLSPEQYIQVVNLYTRLSDANRSLENFAEAEHYMRMALKMLAQAPEPADAKILGWKTLGLARILSMKGSAEDLQEGELLFGRAQELFRQAQDVSSEGYVNLFWGQLKMFQGCFEEAFSKTETAYSMLLEAMGEYHVDLAKVCLFEGNIWRAKGDEANALRCYDQAIDGMVQRKNFNLAQKAMQVRNSGKIGYTN